MVLQELGEETAKNHPALVYNKPLTKEQIDAMNAIDFVWKIRESSGKRASTSSSSSISSSTKKRKNNTDSMKTEDESATQGLLYLHGSGTAANTNTTGFIGVGGVGTGMSNVGYDPAFSSGYTGNFGAV